MNMVLVSAVVRSPASAASLEIPTPTALNAKDIGAVGDGVADDTQALQSALDAAAAQVNSTSYGGLFDGAYPSLDLGCGTYRITAPLYYKTYVRIIASRARIVASGFTGFALDFTPSVAAGYRMELENITLVGAGVRINNSGVDTGNITLRNLEFFNCGTALDVSAQSSSVRVVNCLWHGCTKVLINRACDYLLLDGGRIDSCARTANKQADIDNYGRLVLRDFECIPMNNLGGFTESAWVNNNYDASVFAAGGRSGMVQIERGYFGGEPGAYSTVNNFADASPNYYTHTVVTIIGASVWSYDGTIGTSCAIVRLFKIPNDLQIKDCTGFKDTLALCWGSGVNGSTEVASKPASSRRVKLDNIAQTSVLTYTNPANYLLPELAGL